MVEIDSSPLRRHRKSLEPRVAQYRLAEAAGITAQWLNYLENRPGQPTSYTTAMNLLSALNIERLARGLPALALEDLKLTIK